ncbi:hypothetical protein Psuf_010030 [Phytohabitans suffuscus]|uniref:NACHT domain-containing protein n=1 Tax=Phytohabitans suffuscus TaxID=624315 RepID=A0A6F8YCA2_9ACTN|nr:hypothetical protein Psuf_010030 [Phytohabitans suffuscus]
MAALDAALTVLSSNVIQTVLDYWLRRGKDRSEPLDEFLDAQVPNPLDRRRLQRRIDALKGLVQQRLDAETDDERLNEDARLRVADAVRETFARASLSPSDIQDAHSDPIRLMETVRARASLDTSLFHSSERHLYEALLSETAAVLVTAASAVPTSRPYLVAQLLRDEDEVYSSVRRLLDDLPTPAPASDGDVAYRLSVVTSLDRTEIVGFTLPVAMRSFSLSSTYTQPRVTVKGDEMPVDWALADFPMLYLTGPAGSGKTALLRWLAVSSARRSLDGLLGPHNDLLPLYLPAGRLGQTASENAESAVDFILDHVRPSLPASLTRAELHRRCREGQALVLIDGLDEFGRDGIDRLRHWLSELLTDYPNCRFVVSSRRAAVDSTFLADAGFTVASLNPLDDAGVTDLVSRWFSTVSPSLPERTLQTPRSDWPARSSTSSGRARSFGN